MEEQLKLNFERVAICENDVLLVKIEANEFHFVNKAGFITEDPPEGSLIQTEAYGTMIGVSMPSIRGILHYEDSRPLFYPHDCLGRPRTAKCSLFKLWGNDVITLLKIPQSLSAPFRT